MEAKTTDKKTFQLTENGETIGEIVYENLLFLTAKINLSDSGSYDVAPVGFFGTSIAVTQNGAPIANLVMSWNGQIVITFQDGQAFCLKLSGIFSNKFIVENKDKEKLLQIESKFNWREFQYSHEIIYNVEYPNKPDRSLLSILCIYSVNCFIATMSGANAGIY